MDQGPKDYGQRSDDSWMIFTAVHLYRCQHTARHLNTSTPASTANLGSPSLANAETGFGNECMNERTRSVSQTRLDIRTCMDASSSAWCLHLFIHLFVYDYTESDFAQLREKMGQTNASMADDNTLTARVHEQEQDSIWFGSQEDKPGYPRTAASLYP